MVEFNQLQKLITIPYKWGGSDPKTGLDCFTLANYARQVLSGESLKQEAFDYQQLYKEENLAPKDLVSSTCTRLLLPREGKPEHLDLLLVKSFPRGSQEGLGTYLEVEGKPYALYFSSVASQIAPWDRFYYYVLKLYRGDSAVEPPQIEPELKSDTETKVETQDDPKKTSSSSSRRKARKPKRERSSEVRSPELPAGASD